MTRYRWVCHLLLVTVVLAGCGSPEVAPPLDRGAADATGETGGVATSDDDGGGSDVTDAIEVGAGEVANLSGDVRIGVYSILGTSRAQLNLHAGDESVEVAELRVGDVEEVGGHRFELIEVTPSAARIAVTDPDGAPLEAPGR